MNNHVILDRITWYTVHTSHEILFSSSSGSSSSYGSECSSSNISISGSSRSSNIISISIGRAVVTTQYLGVMLYDYLKHKTPKYTISLLVSMRDTMWLIVSLAINV